MAKYLLVDESITAGAQLVESLAGSPYDPESALWFYRPETEDWVLMLGSGRVSGHGSRDGYELVGEVLKQSQLSLKLDDVVFVDNDDPLLRLLRSALKTGSNLDRIRFSKNRIGNAFIEDALIYRLQETRNAVGT